MRSSLAILLVALSVACGGGGGESVAPDPSGGSEGAEGSTGEGSTTGTGESSEGASAELVMSDDACTTDADCVPAGCCHAAACTAAANATSCDDVMCTSECRYGTLDCGGSCLCHEGHCAARLSAPPAGVGDLPPPS